MKILIGGDIVPTAEDQKMFIDGNIEGLIDEGIYSLIDKSDVRIYNLEVSVTDSEKENVKSGPHLKCAEKCINGIRKLKPTILVGANNHSMDYCGGIRDTSRLLANNNIDYIGVGNSRDEARENSSRILGFGDLKIGIYCVGENEFNSADEFDGAGINVFNELYTYKDVKKISDKADYTIVLYHGGLEYYRLPSPELQEIFYEFTNVGADLVVAQHNHCVASEEIYNGARLIYGQGNFIYKNKKYDKCGNYNDGMLIEIDIPNTFDKEKVQIIYHPILSEEKTKLVEGERKKKIFEEFNSRSELTANREEIIYRFSWEARKRFDATNKRIMEYDMLHILGCMQCRTLRELIVCAYNISIGNTPKEFLKIIPNDVIIDFFTVNTVSAVGAGVAFENIFYYLKNRNLGFQRIFSTKNKRIEKLQISDCKYKVYPIELCEDKNEIMLICTGSEYQREIYETLMNMGFKNIYAIGDIWSLK